VEKEWDRSLSSKDLVVCTADYPTLHIYRVVDIRRRCLYAEDLFNHPSLKEKKYKVGDEYAPLVLLRLHRPAPTWDIVGPPAQEKVVDGFLVLRLSSSDLDSLFKNLAELKEEIDADSVLDG
jgi:hypothetical protein